MSISNDLFQLTGFFEKYQETGGVISSRDAQFLCAHLSAAAHGTRAMEVAHKFICADFDSYVEKFGGPADRRPVRVFELVQGGRG